MEDALALFKQQWQIKDDKVSSDAAESLVHLLEKIIRHLNDVERALHSATKVFTNLDRRINAVEMAKRLDDSYECRVRRHKNGDDFYWEPCKILGLATGGSMNEIAPCIVVQTVDGMLWTPNCSDVRARKYNVGHDQQDAPSAHPVGSGVNER